LRIGLEMEIMTGDKRSKSGENKPVDKGLYRVGEAARLAGVSRQSLQYYLMLGIIEPTEVTKTGRRMFDAAAIAKIRLVKKLNESGYTLRAIREIFMQGK